MGLVDRVCDRLVPTYEGIGVALRTEPAIGADETGWRIERRNGRIWSFCNERLAYFVADHSRAAKVPEAALGKDFAGTVTCDFYAGYNFLPKLQRCWIHLLRDIEAERRVLPASVMETCRLNGHRLVTWLRDALAATPGQLPSPFAADPSTS